VALAPARRTPRAGRSRVPPFGALSPDDPESSKRTRSGSGFSAYRHGDSKPSAHGAPNAVVYATSVVQLPSDSNPLEIGRYSWECWHSVARVEGGWQRDSPADCPTVGQIGYFWLYRAQYGVDGVVSKTGDFDQRPRWLVELQVGAHEVARAGISAEGGTGAPRSRSSGAPGWTPAPSCLAALRDAVASSS
jgi:hypothetical protein